MSWSGMYGACVWDISTCKPVAYSICGVEGGVVTWSLPSACMYCKVTVVGCVCVSGSISANNSYWLPQRWWRFNLNVFFVKQPIRKATEFLSKLLTLLSAILFAFASARTHFSCQLCLCVCMLQYSAHSYLNHWTLILARLLGRGFSTLVPCF